MLFNPENLGKLALKIETHKIVTHNIQMSPQLK
jgi:hypothetical protein